VATGADILPGMGFWIKSQLNSTQIVVMAGDVVDQSVFTNRIVTGYQMLSYPYSSPIALNSTSFKNGAFSGPDFSSSDNVLIWQPDSQTYKSYWLLGDVGDDRGTNVWIDQDTDVVTTDIIRPCFAFWYYHLGTNFNWVEAKPYVLN
jgi:hypothetical protein